MVKTIEDLRASISQINGQLMARMNFNCDVKSWSKEDMKLLETLFSKTSDLLLILWTFHERVLLYDEDQQEVTVQDECRRDWQEKLDKSHNYGIYIKVHGQYNLSKLNQLKLKYFRVLGSWLNPV